MYQKKAKGWTKHADFMVWDMVALQIAFVFSYIVRHGFVNPYAMLIYRDMAIFLGIVDVLVLILFETLKNVLKRGYYKEFAITVKHVLIVELAASIDLWHAFGLETVSDEEDEQSGSPFTTDCDHCRKSF